MKNKTGKIIGFLAGAAGFLLLFKVIFLVRLAPEDELAPGVVVIASVLSGVVCAWAGGILQNKLANKH